MLEREKNQQEDIEMMDGQYEETGTPLEPDEAKRMRKVLDSAAAHGEEEEDREASELAKQVIDPAAQ